MTTATLGSTGFPTALGAEAIARDDSDLSRALKALFQSTMQAGRIGRDVGLGAMRMLWRWIAAVIERIASLLGFRARVPQEPSDKQLAGENPTDVELVPNDANAASAGIDPVAAKAAVIAEATRHIQYLVDNPIDPEILANPALAHEAVRHHAELLGRYHAVFKARAQEIDQEIDANCEAIAGAIGTKGPIVRAQLESARDGGLYDKDGNVKALMEQSREMRLAMGRVELAATGLLRAAEHPEALGWVRQHTLGVLSRFLPGVPVDHAPHPTAAVGASSGETSTVGGDGVAHVPADVPAPAAIEDAQQAQARALRVNGSLARNGISAKKNIEFGPLTRSAAPVANASLRLVSGPAGPSVSDEMKQQALASSFVGASFANLMAISDQRRERDKSDWGDSQAT